MELIISLIAGALGGNGAAAMLKNLSLGTVGNSIAGIVGGGIGGQVIAMLLGGTAAVDPTTAAATSGLDIGAIVAQVAGGGVGGAVVMAIVGAIKNAMSRT